MNQPQKFAFEDDIQGVERFQSLCSEWTVVSKPEDLDSLPEARTEMERLLTAKQMLGNHLQIVLNAKNEAAKIHQKREEWSKAQLEDAESRIAQLLNQNTDLLTALETTQDQKASIEHKAQKALEIAEVKLEIRVDKEKVMRQEYVAAQHRNGELSNNNTTLSKNLTHAEAKIKQLTEEINETSESYQKANALNDSLLKEKGSWEHRLQDMTQGYSETLDELMDAEQRTCQLESEIEEVSSLYEDAKALNITLLEEKTDSNKKLEGTTRNLAEAIDKLNGDELNYREGGEEIEEFKNLREDSEKRNIRVLIEVVFWNQRSHENNSRPHELPSQAQEIHIRFSGQTPHASILNTEDIETIETETTKLKHQLETAEQEKKDAIDGRQHAEQERERAILCATILVALFGMAFVCLFMDLIKLS